MTDDTSRPLDGLLVVDLSRHLPGPFASRELLRRGARVVRLEAPEGDPLRRLVPAWHRALNAGKESVVCDLKREPEFGRALCAKADVVIEGFRPGVAKRLGLGAEDLPDRVIYCSISGFGPTGRHASRVGHDLNYLGFAGVLAATAPALPPLPIADLAAGSLTAVNEILLALYQRSRTGRGRRLDISMTHRAHALQSYRHVDEERSRLLTGAFACYGMYAAADGRWLTVAALEPPFFRRLCELLGCPDLTAQQFDAGAQEKLTALLTEIFSSRPAAEWLRRFEREEVCVGPVNTLAEADVEFGVPETAAPLAELGAHTDQWRTALIGVE